MAGSTSPLTVAYEQFVIDDEIIGMCGRVLKGIPVDPERLALKVIDTVGPGGNFMTAPHPLDLLHTEYIRGSNVTDQKDRDTIGQNGNGTRGAAEKDFKRRPERRYEYCRRECGKQKMVSNPLPRFFCFFLSFFEPSPSFWLLEKIH